MDNTASEARRPIEPLQVRPASLIWVAVGGAAGTLARYGLHVWFGDDSGGVFPWDILAANIVGCLIAGFVIAVGEGRRWLDATAGLVVRVGFLASFTSFSAFAFGTVQLARDDRWLASAGNVLLTNSLMVVAVVAGLWAGNSIGKKVLSPRPDNDGDPFRES